MRPILSGSSTSVTMARYLPKKRELSRSSISAIWLKGWSISKDLSQQTGGGPAVRNGIADEPEALLVGVAVQRMADAGDDVIAGQLGIHAGGSDDAIWRQWFPVALGIQVAGGLELVAGAV